ncbi:MAG: peptide-methionine (S)-S-oxide reductase MsrA [Alphaproteobacteria bacterium]|nr:peptide-methionine (S)-S-oxide reductase MsrA [Alphaproteobacteria bacterium]
MPHRSFRLAFVLGLLLSALSATAFAQAGTSEKDLKTAIFAGGCFWCVESDFDNVPGVVRTISGYTGGITPNPTYKQVSADNTGHREAVQITYDPKKVSCAALVDILFHSVDPTDGGGQFCDRGESYKTAIFATSAEQKRIAQETKHTLQESKILKDPIVTTIEDAGPFFPAEDYHQDYYKKNPVRYRFYRHRCGRDGRVEALWGKDAHRGIAKH